MNRVLFLAFLIVISFGGFSAISNVAIADDTAKTGGNNAAETARIDSRLWGFALLPKEVAINEVGLPQHTFTRTTLVYVPTQGPRGDNPTAVTLCLAWPEGTRDASTSDGYKHLQRLRGTSLESGGRMYWVFDIENHLNALLNEGAEWYIEQDSAAKRFLNLGPRTFTSGAAWSFVHPGLGLGDRRIDVGDERERDGGRLLKLLAK